MRLGGPDQRREAHHHGMAKVEGRRRALPRPLLILLLAVWFLQLAMLVPPPVTFAVTFGALTVYFILRRANDLH